MSETRDKIDWTKPIEALAQAARGRERTRCPARVMESHPDWKAVRIDALGAMYVRPFRDDGTPLIAEDSWRIRNTPAAPEAKDWHNVVTPEGRKVTAWQMAWNSDHVWFGVGGMAFAAYRPWAENLSRVEDGCEAHRLVFGKKKDANWQPNTRPIPAAVLAKLDELIDAEEAKQDAKVNEMIDAYKPAEPKLWQVEQLFRRGNGQSRWYVDNDGKVMEYTKAHDAHAWESHEYRSVAAFESAIRSGELKPVESKPAPATYRHIAADLIRTSDGREYRREEEAGEQGEPVTPWTKRNIASILRKIQMKCARETDTPDVNAYYGIAQWVIDNVKPSFLSDDYGKTWLPCGQKVGE